MRGPLCSVVGTAAPCVRRRRTARAWGVRRRYPDSRDPGYPLRQRFPGQEGRHVGPHDLGDATTDRGTAHARHMRCDEQVRAGPQRMVGRRRFRIGDIQARGGEPARPQGLDQGGCVDDGTAGGVHQNAAGLHGREGASVDHPLGCGCQAALGRENPLIGLSEFSNSPLCRHPSIFRMSASVTIRVMGSAGDGSKPRAR